MAGKLIAVGLVAAVLAGTALAGDPRKQHNAADNAKAKAIGLTRADLPAGWTAKPSAPSGKATCKSFNPNESDLVETGSADSPDFTGPDGISTVSSKVGIFKTAAHAQASWSRVVRPELLGCFAEVISTSAPKGTAMSVVSKGALAFPKLAPRTAAYRLVVGVKPKGATTALNLYLNLYLDLILLGRDRADVVTTLLSPAKPFAPAFERKLATAIARRMH